MSIDADLRVYATKDNPGSLMNKKFNAQPFSDFWIYLNHDQKSIIAQIVEQAILAEREACAKICDRFREYKLIEAGAAGNWLNDDGFSTLYGQELAALIRARKNPSNLPQNQSETLRPTIPTPES